MFKIYKSTPKIETYSIEIRTMQFTIQYTSLYKLTLVFGKI